MIVSAINVGQLWQTLYSVLSAVVYKQATKKKGPTGVV